MPFRPQLLETLDTDETDTALVPHPDGMGGVVWGTDATSGGVSSLVHKAGSVAGGSFASSGSPSRQRFTVTFAGAFAAAPNVTLGWDYVTARTFSVESVAAGSFVIVSSSNATHTGNVYWIAMATGESS